MTRTTSNEKGMIFSLDFAIAFILLLAILVIFVLFTYNSMTEKRLELEEYSLQRKRVMLLDSLVKRKPEIGLAGQDFLKRRVQEHRLFGSVEQRELFTQIGLTELTVECDFSTHDLFKAEEIGKKCDVLERLVFYNNQKCKLKAKYCDEL